MKLIGKRFENERLNMDIFVYNSECGEIKNMFIGYKIADLLDYSDCSATISKKVNSRYKLTKYVKMIESVGNCQNGNSEIINNNMTLINEFGLYQLVCSSKKKEAIEFQNWIYEEVLPSLRKHKMYADDTVTKKDVENYTKENKRLRGVLNNYSKLYADKRRKAKAKSLLETMFPVVEDVYEQFLGIMKKSKLLDDNSMPTAKFVEENKKNKLFTHNFRTCTDSKVSLELTNLGIEKLVNTLIVEDGKIRILK